MEKNGEFMDIAEIQPDMVIRGPIFPEPVKVITTVLLGECVKIVGEGTVTGKVHQPVLNKEQIRGLDFVSGTKSFAGDPAKFRLGIEALRLSLAYHYDPYFSLSLARVEPLPHQLEAVYGYFLKLPRIRFLLADDPGAGKTIMAGLLIKELKIRGLIRRILIVTPANLCFQWQRELADKFREKFDLVKGEVLRSGYGTNPWQEKNQVITSVSWVSRIADAKDSLMRSRWDLIIVDEAHKMSAYSEDKKTLMYQLGEALSERTDHYLLMTATPHKGDPANFSLFLKLLDKDIYADVKSLEKAVEDREAPFYLRRVKEAMITFPDPDTGKSKNLFTKRIVQTAAFQIDKEELELYDCLTRYVENQSAKAFADNSPKSRVVGFTMAMLQRRFASSVYAVRRSLERMKKKREEILADPKTFSQEQISRKMPEDFEELPEEMKEEILAQLENAVVSADPISLRGEIAELDRLICSAKLLETRELESKLSKLRQVIREKGIFDDPNMKLLIFTEHKDTLDYLAGDGKNGRPLGKLAQWGLRVTRIHGGMKIGDMNTPGTRIYAEREFRETCQILVATEAAGEGINLQFCWYLINYDVPWNPNRLEQRMGRIHRYGQEKDCLISNFVSTNTREGRVLEKLFERIDKIEDDLDPGHTGKIYNVLGDVFPANQLEKWLREMYASNQMTEELIKQRIAEQVDTERLRRITESALEGLAKRELNLNAITGKSELARERRLVPEVIEDFFLQAAPVCGISVKKSGKQDHIFRIGRIPGSLLCYGEKLESDFGKLSHEYRQIVFDKKFLSGNSAWEWVTPGHPLFESVRAVTVDRVEEDMEQGAVFYDLHRSSPALLDVFTGEIRDGLGNVVHKGVFVIQTEENRTMCLRQASLFSDFCPAPKHTELPRFQNMPSKEQMEAFVYQHALIPLLEEETRKRKKEIRTISEHMNISLNTIIDRVQNQFAELYAEKEAGSQEQGLEGRLKMLEDRLDDLNRRLVSRKAELVQQEQCSISHIRHVSSAWVLPHPERESPLGQRMRRDPEIEKTAVDAVTAYEQARGCRVQSVENENRGFDLISRRPHSEDPETSVEVRFIEVKGRSGAGDVALTGHEYKTAQRLGQDYWLYAVFHCAEKPVLHLIQNPARMQWKPVVTVEHYQVSAEEIQTAVQKTKA